MLLMKCEAVSLGYDKKSIIDGVSFEVHEGDYIAITGENGVGKSTLVKTLLGLIPTLDGRITLCEGMSCRDIGYLPQSSFIGADFPASAEEVVESGFIADRRAFPFYRREHKEKARANMERLGILHLKDKPFGELSGGQSQRVLLARALCAAKKMLLLDEPVQGLDPAATHEMYDAVKGLNREDKMAVLMVSHDICSTLAYATHVLHLGKDRIFFSEVEEYRRSDVGHEFIYAHGGLCDCEEHTVKPSAHSHDHDHDHSHEEDKK